jgi:hypothetical protein
LVLAIWAECDAGKGDRGDHQDSGEECRSATVSDAATEARLV